MVTRIHTVGHSTRSAEALVEILAAHGVRQLADIRTVPRSRRHPHFAREAMEQWLPARGIAYRHLAALGGLRRPRPDSINGGWRHPSFRGYADYMQTPAFAAGLDALLAFGEGGATTIMCAEAVWWQCHRQLVADALVARGLEVLHLMSAADATPHHLTSFARVRGGMLCYPGLLDEVAGGTSASAGQPDGPADSLRKR